MVTRVLLAVAAFLAAVPAAAAEAASVPEGSHFTLFALGVLGVIIGRRAVMSAQRRQRARDAETK